jgi:phosphohistidine phosphatase
MNIYLLRHGIAAPHGEGNQFNDAERPLTPEGITKMRQVSKGLKRLGVTFDIVASSSLLRAKETAEIVVDVLKFNGSIQLWDELAPGGSISKLMQKLQKYRNKDSVLLVGHQPDMGSLASSLILGTDSVSLSFKKGGACCIQVNEFPPHYPGELVWMLTPKILGLIGK